MLHKASESHFVNKNDVWLSPFELMSDEVLRRRTRHLSVLTRSRRRLMTNCSIVFTITCQGERAARTVLLATQLTRAAARPCVIGQKWKPVEMFTGHLHYVSSISDLVVVCEQACGTAPVWIGHCSPSTGVEGSCRDLQILKKCLRFWAKAAPGKAARGSLAGLMHVLWWLKSEAWGCGRRQAGRTWIYRYGTEPGVKSHLLESVFKSELEVLCSYYFCRNDSWGEGLNIRAFRLH